MNNSKQYNELTIFIICTDKKKFIKKKKILLKQYRHLKNIKPIISVYPMSSAFNEMHLRCKTKYFLQLDEDMFLKKGAINFLLDKIKKSNFFTVCVTGNLYEEDFGVGGAIKIWKKSIFRLFSFSDYRAVDRNFFRKILIFKKQSFNVILGKHVPRFNNFSKFSKVIGDVCKWKYLKSNRIFIYQMLQRLIINKNFYEIIALLISLNISKSYMYRSKNYFKDQLIYKKIKIIEKNFYTSFFYTCNNCISFFNIFIKTYENKKNINYFNKFFLNNLLKLNQDKMLYLKKVLNSLD